VAPEEVFSADRFRASTSLFADAFGPEEHPCRTSARPYLLALETHLPSNRALYIVGVRHWKDEHDVLWLLALWLLAFCGWA